MDDIKIDELIRARRKSIGLIITNDARLIVRAPYSAPLNYIQQLVNQKRSWITKKRRFFFDKKTTTFSKTFCDGEQFLFLGQRYPLTIDDNLAKSVIFDGTLRIARVSLANAKDHLGYWYKAQANDFIHQRVEHYANLCGLT